MCDYLKEKYSLDNTVYELAGLIHTNIYWLEHAKYIPEYESLVGNFSRTGIKLDDGRDFSYSLYYYSLTLEHEYPSYMKLSEKDINNLKQNIRGELINIINLVTKFKPASTGRSDTDSDSPDFDYCLEDIQKARAHIINLVNSKKEQIRARETRKQLVESLTEPIKNTDPNYIETAECPNCHKKSVYRISDMKRGASIGFFGLFSKNIGKTMECRSCGYKW